MLIVVHELCILFIYSLLRMYYISWECNEIEAAGRWAQCLKGPFLRSARWSIQGLIAWGRFAEIEASGRWAQCLKRPISPVSPSIGPGRKRSRRLKTNKSCWVAEPWNMGSRWASAVSKLAIQHFPIVGNPDGSADPGGPVLVELYWFRIMWKC